MLMEADKGVPSAIDAPQDLIVIVEDHEDSLLLLSFILNDLCDGRVLGFRDGQTALAQIPKLQPSLVLLDIVLPDIAGTEVMLKLKATPLTRKIPIVAVTALAKPDDRDRFLEGGFDDYISKPYLFDDIAAVIGRYIRLQTRDDRSE
jgi:two-component system, cell cycle response regulator DivK